MSGEARFRFTQLHAGDKTLTDIFVARAKKGDKYVCWGCGKEFPTPDEFITHFQEHLNSFFSGEKRQ